METIAKRKMGIKKITLFSVLVFSTLATQANTVGGEFNHMLHNPENLTMVYVLGGMFLVCFMLYLLGRHFTHKDDRHRNMIKPTHQRLSRQRVIKKTS